MKYGFFDDERKEYVITTPFTPQSWINYLGSEDFFSLISNTGTGYSFYKDAKLRRITRFRYNTPTDQGGRNYYIKDGDEIWSPSYLPAKTVLDSYVCRQGLGYTVFESSKNAVKASLMCFVPVGEACEINVLKLHNEGKEARDLSVFSAVEWCLWNAVDDSTNFQRNFNIAEVEVEGSTLYHKTEYRERRNHYAFYHVNQRIEAFDTERRAFLGLDNGYESPIGVLSGKLSNSIATSWAPTACHQVEVRLEAGETRSLIFILGYCENPKDKKFVSANVINKEGAHRIIQAFDTEEKVDKAFEVLKGKWEKILNRFSIESSNDKVNRMLNIWNQYQCMITYYMSRSASFFESGIGRGMGFRDSCQDLLGCVHLIPELSRQRILDIAAIQSEDGSTFHQYQPLTKTGNADVGSGFNDDPLWLVACVSAYLRETGDSTILNEPVQFKNVEGSEKPLMEHLRRSINFTIDNKGKEGLPLIGRADWNDCLNLNCFSTAEGESFQTCSNQDTHRAESVFIAGMFVKYAREYAEICRRYGDEAEAEMILGEVEAMNKAVIDNGWDGDWYLRAYDAFGNKIGSHECEEGKIFIEPQGFCSMAKIGLNEGLPQKALESVKRYLLCDYGVTLLSPCYTSYHVELGEISSYPPGYKENGSVFCHNNNWIVMGFSELGDGENAFDIYRRTCPAYFEDISDIHGAEPYVYCQTVAGPQTPTYGEAKNSWLTGTAAWGLVSLTQGLMGIIPDFEGLRIRPCLSKEFSSYRAKRLFRGTVYEIEVTKGNKTGIFVEGKQIEGDLVPHVEGRRSCHVKVLV